MCSREGNESNANMDVKNIIASLKYGILFPKSYLLLLGFGIGTALMLPVLTIIMLIVTITIGLVWDVEMAVIYAVLTLFGTVLAIYYTNLIFKNKKIKAHAKLVMADAIFTKAKTRTIDVRKPIVIKKEIQIDVKFEIDYKRYLRVSGDGGTKNTQYQKIYTKYADREIDIMYSKKYDEVLILKDKAIYTVSAIDDN